MEFEIDGTPRQAVVYVPKTSPPEGVLSPVVFGFHGHGGTTLDAERSFAVHRHWPEAVVVYMQGLPVAGRKKEDDGFTGWQMTADESNGSDLKFFDQLLSELVQKHQVDPRRVYVTGHSMGGSFTFLLWFARPNAIAAFAPSGAFVAQQAQQLMPKPMLQIAGKNDEVVKFSSQEKTVKDIRRLNRCDSKGIPWAPNCTMYKSKKGPPVLSFVHEGAHNYPNEGPAITVKFFREIDSVNR